MISFSKNVRVALRLIRSVIYISTVPIVFLCGGALGSCSAQEVLSGQSEAAEFQKLEPALKFLPERNRRGHLHRDRRNRAMDHDSRRGPQQPGAALPVWRARRCDQSLGIRSLS